MSTICSSTLTVHCAAESEQPQFSTILATLMESDASMTFGNNSGRCDELFVSYERARRLLQGSTHYRRSVAIMSHAQH